MFALKLGVKPTNYKKFSIRIKSAYEWGRGWYAPEEEAFKAMVNPKLKELGYTIVEGHHGVIAGTSDTAMKPNTKTSIYLHPMEFAGIATEDEIGDLMDMLEDCFPVITDHNLDYSKFLYDINDEQYKEILEKNKKDIIDFLVDYDFHPQFAPNLPEEFVLGCRPLFLNAKSYNGYSPMDTDYSFVQNIIETICDKFNHSIDFEKGKGYTLHITPKNPTDLDLNGVDIEAPVLYNGCKRACESGKQRANGRFNLYGWRERYILEFVGKVKKAGLDISKIAN